MSEFKWMSRCDECGAPIKYTDQIGKRFDIQAAAHDRLVREAVFRSVILGDEQWHHIWQQGLNEQTPTRAARRNTALIDVLLDQAPL